MRLATFIMATLILAGGVATSLGAVEITTQHADNARTGANTAETQLTPANVNQAGFGARFTASMNANVNGQALYMPGLTIAGATHNAVFVYTSNNTNGSPCGIYAFDAVSGAALWSRSLTNAAQYTTNTPAIDSASKTMFFVSKDNDNNGANWLHAVDLLTGNERSGSPVQVNGSVSGSGSGGSGGTLTFPATHANCRPGILLQNGRIYLGFSFNSDARPYHGWVFAYGYNANGTINSPAAAVYCVTPDANSAGSSGYSSDGGGIWQAGKGLISDGSSVYCTTGNGNFTVQNGGRNYSMCFLKLALSNLAVQDWFAEARAIPDSDADADLGNCGPLLIPGTQVLFAGAAKYGRGHLVDATAMGHFNSGSDTCLQTVSSGLGSGVGQNAVAWDAGGGNRYVYCWSNGHGIAQYRYSATAKHLVDGAGVNTGNPLHQGASTSGGSMSVSANGTGGGILWAVGNDSVVHAYDATDVTHELWNSNQNSARDGLPSVGKFQFPLVAAGRLYVPTGNGKLVCYGLLSSQVATRLAFSQQPTSASAGSAISPAVKVTVQDAGGATVTGSSAAVTLAIGSNPAGGTLAGTLTANAVNGVATFANLSINNPGTGYTLTAAASGLSGATSAAFNILATVAAPTFDPNGGSYSGPVTVRLADATSGAAIHYTTDGSTPTSGSPTYGTPFQLTASATVKAIATKSGLANSAVASAAFTITGSTAYGMPYRPVVSGLNVPATNTNPPATLSATNVFNSLSTLTPAGGIVPYGVNTPLWSDNAVKSRWIALPGTSRVTFRATGEWSFPGGTILVKHFELGTNDTNPSVRKRLETRLLVLNSSGTGGYGITYKWRADNSDADLVAAGGLDEAISITTASGTRTQTWHYPSQNECLTCHTTNAGFVLGPKTRQLNGTFTYPGTGVADNQLRTWNYLQMFSGNIGEGNIPGFTRLKAVTDSSATLEDRVKSYLDANCAQCHRPGGVATAWDARYDTPMGSQGIINGAVKTDLGIAGAKVAVPRDTTHSILRVRMASTDNAVKMPPLARNLVDTAALAVVDQWINGLPVGGSSGFAATYFDNADLTGASVLRTDQTIDFNWGGGTPDPAIGVDTFSVRWTAQITPAHSETYTFYATTDDGVRLWLNGQLLIDKWVAQSATTWSATLPMIAGQRYNLKMEYYEQYGDAVARLEWSSPSTPRQVIPAGVAMPSGLFAVDINFQPAASPVYGNGWVVDSSQPYGPRGNGFTYGWNTAFDETRDRNNAGSPDQRYDTFNHLQKDANPNAVWEIAVPNGTYQVRVVSGDPNNLDSVFRTNVEGVLLVDGTPSGTPFSAHWVDSGYQTVTVSDGRLTVSNASGAANNKICFIEIVQLPPAVALRDGGPGPLPFVLDDPTAVLSTLMVRLRFGAP
jgi:uncharacterized repeat protein (TIGR03806 family)